MTFSSLDPVPAPSLRAARALLVLALGALAGTTALVARAEEPSLSRPFRVHVDSAAGCPDPTTFDREVEARAHAAHRVEDDAAAPQFDVRIEARAGRFWGHVIVHDQGERSA